VEDIISAHYACYLASLFIEPTPYLDLFLSDSLARPHPLVFATWLFETRYSCDVDLVAPFVLAEQPGMLPPDVSERLENIKKLDAIPTSQRIHSRASSSAQIDWRVGDIVKVRVETGADEVIVVVGWEVRAREHHDLRSSSLADPSSLRTALPLPLDADPTTLLAELHLYEGGQLVVYSVVSLEPLCFCSTCNQGRRNADFLALDRSTSAPTRPRASTTVHSLLTALPKGSSERSLPSTTSASTSSASIEVRG
jgi:hypothetical protein